MDYKADYPQIRQKNLKDLGLPLFILFKLHARLTVFYICNTGYPFYSNNHNIWYSPLDL